MPTHTSVSTHQLVGQAMQSKQDLFAELYSENQQRLFGYVVGLVRNMADAQEIVQQTAITAWQKFDTFDPDSSFIRWAITIARYETLNFAKYRRRSRVYFDHELMEQLAETTCERPASLVVARTNALSSCMKKLNASDSRLIECRYAHGLGSHQIAKMLERSQSSVCNSLKRIRQSLLQCIERQVEKEGQHESA